MPYSRSTPRGASPEPRGSGAGAARGRRALEAEVEALAQRVRALEQLAAAQQTAHELMLTLLRQLPPAPQPPLVFRAPLRPHPPEAAPDGAPPCAPPEAAPGAVTDGPGAVTDGPGEVIRAAQQRSRWAIL